MNILAWQQSIRPSLTISETVGRCSPHKSHNR
jgi:hypothetical protein